MEDTLCGMEKQEALENDHDPGRLRCFRLSW